MDKTFAIGTVVWIVFATLVSYWVSNNLRVALRDRVSGGALRSELGVYGSSWTWAFLSVARLPRTRFDLFLTDDGRVVAVPSSRWTLVGAGYVFHFTDPGPVFRIAAFAPSNWHLTSTEAGTRLELCGYSGISSTRLKLEVADPAAWADAIASSTG